jgi:GH18 family chitinase
MKLNYANERCLGGTMIWSVDQDDPQDYAARAFPFPCFLECLRVLISLSLHGQ